MTGLFVVSGSWPRLASGIDRVSGFNLNLPKMVIFCSSFEGSLYFVLSFLALIGSLFDFDYLFRQTVFWPLAFDFVYCVSLPWIRYAAPGALLRDSGLAGPCVAGGLNLAGLRPLG